MTPPNRRACPRLVCLLSFAAALVAACGVWPRSPSVEAGPAPADGGSSAAGAASWQGAASCAAAACHNANGAPGSKGSEYTIWVTQDPHRKAYAVLFNDRSRRIIKNLHRGDAGGDALCLNCHVHSQGQAETGGDPFTFRDEGVACESCHGAAGRWRTEHYLPGWREQSDHDKAERYGMNPTKELAARARLCVACHVGEGVRDVNHDLIAAGHPRLNFEFGSFHAVLPKHWDERAEKERYPDLEARAWAVGQVVSAEAALELLADRARTAAKPWPELAEYNCFACHHELEGVGGRLDRERPPKPGAPALGSVAWGTWYFALLPEALDRSEPADALRQLERQMPRRFPDRGIVAATAAEMVRQLAGRADELARDKPADYDSVQSRFRALARNEARLADTGWDGAAQLYLALAALYHAEGDIDLARRDEALKPALQVLVRQLEFPRLPTIKYDSPRERDFPARLARFHEALRSIQGGITP